ncbi:hypothetical protein CO038_04450 [Candidatus Pacearchaeota archaeon CG_4_9_14_0_2_um_filter_39_13]|nr:hypothetical protein [Candidatus Pacearchaeota archaeon]OIO42591.1 MAG: hypothetical protein AUJ64_03860 [Candidatus Pacearchaeota archaeon CG1_02_39_14]PJC44319.1 MAG: hypothetical protein CO038_04450 [Candidatus Pacearchaeota archaeon CG_4_9_14_0_2_um_filter_39_13]
MTDEYGVKGGNGQESGLGNAADTGKGLEKNVDSQASEKNNLKSGKYYAFLEGMNKEKGIFKFKILTNPSSSFSRHEVTMSFNDAKDIFRRDNGSWKKDEDMNALPYFDELGRVDPNGSRIYAYDVGMYNLWRAFNGMPVIKDEDED